MSQRPVETMRKPTETMQAIDDMLLALDGMLHERPPRMRKMRKLSEALAFLWELHCAEWKQDEAETRRLKRLYAQTDLGEAKNLLANNHSQRRGRRIPDGARA